MKLYDPAVVEAMAVAADIGAGGADPVDRGLRPPPDERTPARPCPLLPPRPTSRRGRSTRFAVEGDRLQAVALGPAAAALGRLYSNVVLGSIVHELALIRAFAGDPVAIDAVDVWPADRWPPSVSITGRLAGDARFAIRWHFLPDYPAYREEVRVVTERATIELEFPSPYLLHAPTDLRVAELAGDGRRDTRFASIAEAFEEELLAFHALVVDGTAPKAGIVEGRADIVTSQRIVARRAAQTGAARSETEAAGLTDATIVHLVPHTHWDREWYEPFQIFRMRLVELVDQLLERMDARSAAPLHARRPGRDRRRLPRDPARGRAADPPAHRRGPPGHRAVADPDGRVPRLGRDDHPQPRARLGEGRGAGGGDAGRLPAGHVRAHRPDAADPAASGDRAGGRLARRPGSDRP